MASTRQPIGRLGQVRDCPEGMHVLTDGTAIREVSDKPIKGEQRLHDPLGGRTLMSGLIDAHIHVYFSDVNWHHVDTAGEVYPTATPCGCSAMRSIAASRAV